MEGTQRGGRLHRSNSLQDLRVDGADENLMNIGPKKVSEKAPNMFMALMGDKAESLDEFNDGVEDDISSGDSLTGGLTVVKEDN